MVGAWLGTAQITVDWTQPRQIEMRVAIDAVGGVAGTVGDATLLDGHLRPNRTFLHRTMRLGANHIIEGGLAGPILRMEDGRWRRQHRRHPRSSEINARVRRGRRHAIVSRRAELRGECILRVDLAVHEVHIRRAVVRVSGAHAIEPGM